MKLTFMPLKSDFKDAVGANPDLYGPIWINATLILLIAASGNLVNLNTVYSFVNHVAWCKV